jgi:hypothetical protein
MFCAIDAPQSTLFGAAGGEDSCLLKGRAPTLREGATPQGVWGHTPTPPPQNRRTRDINGLREPPQSAAATAARTAAH